MVSTQRRGWQPVESGFCQSCGRERDLDAEELCRDCAFVAKARTLSIIAEPWALRQVRREHGISGESDRASEEKKARRAWERGE